MSIIIEQRPACGCQNCGAYAGESQATLKKCLNWNGSEWLCDECTAIVEAMPEHDISPGCPVWGPPGDRHCYDCGEPVDEDRCEYIGTYDDPLAAVLGTCDACGAPAYEVLDDCPACGGPVYKFKEVFACYHTIAGACDFSISVDRMEELDLFPCEINIKHIIHGGLQINSYKSNDPCHVNHALLVRSGDGSWDVEIFDGPLPRRNDLLNAPAAEETGKDDNNDKSRKVRTIGRCPSCGGNVLEQEDCFICEKAISDGGCNFVIYKDDMYDAVYANIVSYLHDMVGDDDYLSGAMMQILDCGKFSDDWDDDIYPGYYEEHGLEDTGFVGYVEYEYYDMGLYRNDEGKWAFKIYHENQERHAFVEEQRTSKTCIR